MGVGIGGTALLSQFIGGDRLETAKHYATNILTIIIIAATVLSLFGF